MSGLAIENSNLKLTPMGLVKTSALWARLAVVVVTAVALGVVLHRLKLDALVAAFRTMRWGWFIAAVVLYGLAFLPATWRWHLVLRLTGIAVHPGATARLTLIGHFFYNILFGAVGGDAAKAALYARWFGWRLPIVLATIPIDRLLGLAGLLVLGSLSFACKATAEAFSGTKLLSFKWSGLWVAAVLVVGFLFVFLMRKLKPGSAWKSFRKAFLIAGKLLLSSPRVAFAGVVSGFLVQAALNGALALNLQAVSHGPIPWQHLVWTLPVIAIVSGLPITVGGLGTREGAALALLGLYGITGSEAVAASLLTFSVSMIWALAGGLLLWRESARQRRQRAKPETISVIIPTLNEAEALEETVQRARAMPEVCEIIVVDGGSRDRTCELAAGVGCRVVTSPPGRGGQLKRGAAVAKGDVLLFLHADTWAPPEAGKAALNCLRDAFAVGGGFWKVFRDPSPLLLGSRIKCAIRLFIGRRIMGDQAMFVRREALEQAGGVPDVPLMEEFELCRRLRRIGRLALADATIKTSARRFAKLGVARTYARMWWVMLRYYLGASAQELRRIYEKE